MSTSTQKDVNPVTQTIAPTKPRRRSPYVWATLIFLCGVLTGAGLGVIGVHLFMTYQFDHPDVAYTRLVQGLTAGLNLTPDEQKRVDEIMRQKEAEFAELFTKQFPALGNAHFDSLRDDVAAALDPQQAAAWRANFERVRSQALPPFPPPRDRRPR